MATMPIVALPTVELGVAAFAQDVQKDGTYFNSRCLTRK